MGNTMMDVWRSVPPVPPLTSKYDCHPDSMYYRTWTGWRVYRGMHTPPLPPWQKWMWNGVATFLLPFQIVLNCVGPLFLWVFRIIPSWGLYLIVTQLAVFPYYRRRLDRWIESSTKVENVSMIEDGEWRRMVRFTLKETGEEYSFRDINCIFGESAGVDHGLDFRVDLDGVQPFNTAELLTDIAETGSPRKLHVITSDNWKRISHQTPFSALKVLLGFLWLTLPTAIPFNLLIYMIVILRDLADGCLAPNVNDDESTAAAACGSIDWQSYRSPLEFLFVLSPLSRVPIVVALSQLDLMFQYFIAPDLVNPDYVAEKQLVYERIA